MLKTCVYVKMTIGQYILICAFKNPQISISAVKINYRSGYICYHSRIYMHASVFVRVYLCFLLKLQSKSVQCRGCVQTT